MANTTNFGWETPDDTDLVKDGAAAMRTLGNSIDTSFVDLKGGTTNQVLAKNSNTDLDFKWVADATGIPATIFDAKGDLIAATAADTADRLAVGTNGQYLSADSTTATGLKWVNAPAGKILQVVSATNSTAKTIISTTYTDTNLTATITPTASTSTILVLVSQPFQIARTNANNNGGTRLMRGTTFIFGENTSSAPARLPKLTLVGVTDQIFEFNINFSYIDSPATTSATTYKTQGALETTANSASITYQQNSQTSSIVLIEIGA